MADIDPAHVLFPSDAPKLDASLDFHGIAKGAAEARLMRQADPDAANVFPGDAAKPDQAAGKDDDIAAKLFGDTTKPDYEAEVGGQLETYRISAHADGDTERSQALSHATKALAADFAAAGTDAEDVRSVFDEVRQSAMLSEMTHEQRQASYSAGLEYVQSAGYSDAELQGARQLVADLEIVSPGVRASLERYGAGNNPKIIAAAVREARKRGYVK